MIKIIKQGTRKTIICEQCGCLFSYENEDIIYTNEHHTRIDTEYLKCPQCDNKIILQDTM